MQTLEQALAERQAIQHYQDTVMSFAAYLRSKGQIAHERDDSVLERVAHKGCKGVYRVWTFDADGAAEAQSPLVTGLPR